MQTNRKYYFVELCRAVACVLITNSHFDGIYPWDISFGGCPGNCLFFLITGFLLAGTDFKQAHFGKWYIRKIGRLYLSLTIVNIIICLIGYRKPTLELFLFPISKFWYIPIIVVLYALYFIVMKYFEKYKALFLGADIIIYLVLYCIVFDRSVFFCERYWYFLILYGFVAMMIGTHIRNHFSCRNKIFHLTLIGCSAISIVGFLGSKLWIATGTPLALNLQFVTQIFSMFFATLFFMGCYYYDEQCRWFYETKLLGKIIKIIGECTLEIYLVQYAIIFYLKDILFPLNLILISLLTFLFGWGLHNVSNTIFRKITS